MSKKRPVQKPSLKLLVLTWLGALLSVAILLFAARALVASIASFRSCGDNVALVANCGKAALNVGDLVIFCWFVLSAALVASTVTAAQRVTRRWYA